jgi:hypothetical protein
MVLPRMLNTGGFVTSRKWAFIEIQPLKNWMKARVPRVAEQPGFRLVSNGTSGNVDAGSSAERSVCYSVEDGVVSMPCPRRRIRSLWQFFDRIDR